MDALLRLQQDIADKLNAHSYFVDVPVMAERPLRTTGEVEQAEFWLVKKDGNKSGTGVLVRVPDLRVGYPNVPGPQFEARLIVRVVEQPLVSEASAGLNPRNTGKSAAAVAKRVAQALHMWAPNGWMQTHLRDQAIVNVAADKRLRMFDVILWTTLPEEFEERTPQPSLTIALGSVTLACAVTADIYYTVDGSFPSQIAGATLYSGSFAVSAGTLVRAAAYASGKEGSDIIEKTA